jgi:hypothetical protein
MIFFKNTGGKRTKKKRIRAFIKKSLVSKRQKFILAVIFLSSGLFVADHILGKSGVSIVFVLSVLTILFLYYALRQDLKENFSLQVFILPFFYSLSVGLFYFLVPARFITRVGMTTLYAIGLYSLFLSQNIFTVSSIRTIQLLSGARTVSLLITLLSYGFLSSVVFSLHINIFVTLILIFIYTFLIVLQSIWTHTLEVSPLSQIFWVVSLSLCLSEISLFLWFSTSSPIVAALFLSAIFYVLIGLTYAWFEKRLFRSVILEYFWITCISFIFLVVFSSLI